MMTAVFAALLAALLLGWYAPRWIGVSAMLVCLGLAVGQFLWEVWSPEYGFRMPWIKVEAPLSADIA